MKRRDLVVIVAMILVIVAMTVLQCMTTRDALDVVIAETTLTPTPQTPQAHAVANPMELQLAILRGQLFALLPKEPMTDTFTVSLADYERVIATLSEAQAMAAQGD